MSKDKMVIHPGHYNSDDSGVECCDIIDNLSFNLAGAIKYIWRRNHKGTKKQDLEKAINHLKKQIDRVEKAQAKNGCKFDHIIDGYGDIQELVDFTHKLMDNSSDIFLAETVYLIVGSFYDGCDTITHLKDAIGLIQKELDEI